MAVLRVHRTLSERVQASYGLARAHPKAALVAQDGSVVVEFPFAPRLTFSGLARRWGTNERSGRKPILGSPGKDLKVISLEALFAMADHQASVEHLLGPLDALAEVGGRVRLRNYGPAAKGWWRITSLEIVDETLQQGTNVRTRATANMTLTEDSTVDLNIGPASGGHKGGGGGKGKAEDSSGGKWPKSYVVKAGDTLSGISIRFYDEASRWRRIADANGIKDPHKLAVGRKLKIPRP